MSHRKKHTTFDGIVKLECPCGKVGYRSRGDARVRAKATSKGDSIHIYFCRTAPDWIGEVWHATSRPAGIQAKWRDRDSKTGS